MFNLERTGFQIPKISSKNKFSENVTENWKLKDFRNVDITLEFGGK